MAYDRQSLFRKISIHLFFSPDLSLADVSQGEGVGRHTIERAVKTAVGMTFRDLRNRIKLEQAVKFLESHPRRSIKEVAFKLHYGSPRAFSRFVRTMAGHSPRELRQILSRDKTASAEPL